VLWLQDAVQLAELASAASEQYAACMAEVDELVSCQYPDQAVPLQLRALEEQLRQRLEVRWDASPLASSRGCHVCQHYHTIKYATAEIASCSSISSV